LTHVPFKGLEN